MKNKIMTKTICVIVASLFFFNSVAYGLSPMPGSTQIVTRNAVVDMAEAMNAAKRGDWLSSLNRTVINPSEFIPSEPPHIEGVNIIPALGGDRLPSFMDMVKRSLENSGISANELSVKNEYLYKLYKLTGELPANMETEKLPNDMTTGEIPIFRKMTVDGKKTLFLDTNIVNAFDDIAKEAFVLKLSKAVRRGW